MNLFRMAAIIALAIPVLACRDSGALFELYRAPFDPQRSAELEQASTELALDLKLTPVKKDKKRMTAITNGTPAFFVFMNKGEDPVVTVSNVGDGTVLTVLVNDYGTIPREDLQRIANTVRSRLEAKLGVPLQLETTAK